VDNRSEFLKIFDSLDVENEDMKDSLAEKVKAVSMEIPGLVAQLSNSDSALTRRKGRAILTRIDNVAITPLLDGMNNNDPDKFIWNLELAADIHRDIESKIVSMLNKSLSDKRPLAVLPMPSHVEEKPDQLRVCDKAYLLLRKLVSFENEESEMVNQRVFAHSWTDEQRDKEIKRLSENGKWISLLERSNEENMSE